MDTQPSSATLTRRVEWVDTDASGHHHHSFILRLVEAAEGRLIADADLGREYAAAAPRVHHEVDYCGPLSFGQDATAVVVLEELGRSSVTFSFEVWGEAFGDAPRGKVASGKVVAAHVPPGSERATPWSDAVVAALHPRSLRTQPAIG